MAIFRTAFPVAMCFAPYARHEGKDPPGRREAQLCIGRIRHLQGGRRLRDGRRLRSRAAAGRDPRRRLRTHRTGHGKSRARTHRPAPLPAATVSPHGPAFSSAALPLSSAFQAPCGLDPSRQPPVVRPARAARRRWRAPRPVNAGPAPEPPAVSVWPCGQCAARAGPDVTREARRKARDGPMASYTQKNTATHPAIAAHISTADAALGDGGAVCRR